MKRQPFVPQRVVRVSGAVAAALLGDSMLYAVLPARVALFAVSPGLVGVLLSVNRFIRLLTNALAARLYLRFGFSGPFYTALVLGAATTAGYGLLRSVWLLLMARVLWGVCWSFLRLGGYLVVLEESRPETRGRLMGFFLGGQRFGSLIGVLLGGALFDLVGREGSFLVIALLSLMGLGLVAGLPSPRMAWPEPNPPGESPSALSGRVWRILVSPAPEFTRGHRYRFLGVSLLQFAVFFAIAGLLVSTLGYYLGLRLGGRGVVVGLATLTGLLLGLRWAADLLGPFLGALSDRFGRGRVIAGALPLLAGGMMVLALSPHLALALASLPLLFLSATTISATLDALAGDLAPPHRRAQLLGRYTTWVDLGSASGPLIGYLAVAVLDLSLAYFLAVGLLGAGALFFAYAFTRPLPRGPLPSTPSSPL